jgi:hypothetical protein
VTEWGCSLLEKDPSNDIHLALAILTHHNEVKAIIGIRLVWLSRACCTRPRA